MSYSVKSVSLGVFLWLRQSGNMDLFCNEVATTRYKMSPYCCNNSSTARSKMTCTRGLYRQALPACLLSC